MRAGGSRRTPRSLVRWLCKRLAQIQQAVVLGLQRRIGADAALDVEHRRGIQLVVEIGVEKQQRLFARGQDGDGFRPCRSCRFRGWPVSTR